MNWEPYRTIHAGLGTLCEVYLDKTENLIKRCFHPNAKTVSGAITRFSPSEIQAFFENEVYWLKKLNGEWLPELVEISTAENFIIQKYYGGSLLDIKYRLHKDIPDVKEQVLEMYKFFKVEGVFKRNGSLSNMSHKNGKIIAFDFKWATQRPDGLEKEIYSYDEYLVKIDPALPQALRGFL